MRTIRLNSTVACGVLFLSLLTLPLLFIAKSAASEDTPETFTRPFPVVMVPTTADDEHRQLARDVASLVGVMPVQESPTNPVCCVWLEITGYTPSPGSPGYTIINQPGGSVISASNIEQLRAAVERFTKSIRQREGKVEVPVGLMTSYPVVVD